MNCFKIAVSVLLIFCAYLSTAQIISSFAGNDTAGFSGDGGPAILAELYGPGGLAIDGSGNLYISDNHNNRIRRVSPAGVITTIAGNGSGIYGGDGGPATAASLHNPAGITTDNAGNLYIADFYNNCVRKVTQSGIISSFAGNDTSGYRGDGGPATAALLYGPTSVAADNAGNIYICDNLNSRLRKVDTFGIITTIAGNGLNSFSGDGGPAVNAEVDPRSVAVDNAGNIYIADYGSTRIRKINTAGIIHTIAGNGMVGYSGDGGPATAAKLYYVSAVTTDRYGNVFIADVGNNSIRSINNEGIITTIAGTGTPGNTGDGGPAIAAKLNSPMAILSVNGDNIYIADYLSNVVRVINAFNNSTPSYKNIAGHTLKIWSQSGAGNFSISVSSPINEPVDIMLSGINGQNIQTIRGITNSVIPIYTNVPTGTYMVSARTSDWSSAEKVNVR